MPMYQFGAGTLWGVRTDINSPTYTATPVKFGALQDVSLEFSATTKELFGGSQFPLAIARGTSKITGKAKTGLLHGRLIGELFFGASLVNGRTSVTANGVAYNIPAASTYTITPAVTIVDDLGVTFGDTGASLRRVVSSPVGGQYTVNEATGVYTFFSGDAGKDVRLSYTYTATSGQSFVVTNKPLGIQPVFKAVLETSYTAPDGIKAASVKLNACVSSKLTVPTKQEDFLVSEFDFSAFADASGEVATFNFSEMS